jgi:hypothetical protein
MSFAWYRAKRKDNFEWIEGYYAKFKCYLTDTDLHVIIPDTAMLLPYSEISHFKEIIPETLCRLVSDADYVDYSETYKLFQGDIVAIWDRHADMNQDKPIDTAVVVDEHSVSDTKYGLGRWFTQDCVRVRVIGNAYDNPELMEGYCLSHFITSLRKCPSDPDDYTKRHRYLSEKYGIHGAHACCYMCNFENDYICHTFNGGCDRIDVCRKIRDSED